MDTVFLPHNSHWHNPDKFKELDPNLLNLSEQAIVYEHKLQYQLPKTEPGIYTLGGGRQIGKSTLLKQWMAYLLKAKINPKSISFISGELIDDHHALVRIVQALLQEMPNGLKYLIIDEVTYIKAWDKAIKYLADIRLFKDVILLLTGSDLALIKQARMTFPGRRGKAAKVNFHLYPLSFREYVEISNEIDIEKLLNEQGDFEEEQIKWLYKKYDRYLYHGGFLTAINDIEKHNKILESTMFTYADWIRGDILKRGKSEVYLREILTAIINRYGSQLSWNAITDAISIDHPNTVADYCSLLESMDAIYIQSALLEDKLSAAPKKAKKIGFTDPFIYHAIRYWLSPCSEPFENQILPAINDNIISSGIVEACIVSHFKRYYPTYYIKSGGEIDLAYVDKKKICPIEVKWRNQIRPKDIRQIAKYKNGKIISKIFSHSEVDNVPLQPIPLALLELDKELLVF